MVTDMDDFEYLGYIAGLNKWGLIESVNKLETRKKLSSREYCSFSTGYNNGHRRNKERSHKDFNKIYAEGLAGRFSLGLGAAVRKETLRFNQQWMNHSPTTYDVQFIYGFLSMYPLIPSMEDYFVKGKE